MTECKNAIIRVTYHFDQNKQTILCYSALSELLDENIKIELTESDIFRTVMRASKGRMNPIILNRCIRKINKENKGSIIIDNSNSLLLCNIYLKIRIAVGDVLQDAFNGNYEITKNGLRTAVLNKLHIKWYGLIYDEITELLEGK